MNISDNQQIKIVQNFYDLIHLKFSDLNNAICWQRNLVGNFEEIVHQLSLKDDITEITIEELNSLDLSKAGVLARNIIIEDFQNLKNFGAQPSLNLLKCYETDNEFDFISTDVYSFHVDRSPILMDTYLCTYYGASSDLVANHQATQKILVPEIRQKLYELHQGSEEGFEVFLKDNFIDLHYEVHQNADIINLGNGNLWRLAVDHPEQPVLPCIHRAPKEENNQYRLMLIC